MKIRKIRIYIISMLLIGIITACFFENPLPQLQTKQAAQAPAQIYTK